MPTLPQLSPTAQRMQTLLTQAGFSCQVIEFSETTRTAQDAADRVHCSVEQIVKSLIFQAQTSLQPVLVLTSGANRVNEAKISLSLGEKIARADADFVRQATGFAIGGVPPMGHIQPLRTFLDEDLLLYPTIWAAAGTPNAVFELTPSDLQKMTSGLVLDLKA